MALSKIQAESMNLADTYAFTGTVSGTSGMTLLETRNDTSDVDYASDTTIFNFDSHTSTFHTFFFSWSLYLNGNGNCHCWLATGDASNTKLNMRTIGHGKIDDGNDAMPASGSGSYHRWAFRAAGPGVVTTVQGYIFNGQRNDDSFDATMSWQSTGFIQGYGQTFANHSSMVTASGDQISRIMINLDGADSGAATNFNAKCKGSLWGVV